MSFEEILDHAIDMLRRRGRLTYRTLQRQFQLDDTALEDLKDELIYGQRLAADEDGRVLVWTGGTDASPTTSPTCSSACTARTAACHRGSLPSADGSSTSHPPSP